MSCGSFAPSQSMSPAATSSASRTSRCLPMGTRCLNSLPNGSVTTMTRLPFTMPLKDTRPPTLASTDGFLGLRASNSSPTRGRPPVMSLVLTLSRSSFAMIRPAFTFSPSSMLRYALPGRKYAASSSPLSSSIVMRGCRVSREYSVIFFSILPGVLVHLLLQRRAQHDVVEADGARGLGDDGLAERIEEGDGLLGGHHVLLLGDQLGPVPDVDVLGLRDEQQLVRRAASRSRSPWR